MGGCSFINCSNHTRIGFRVFRFPANPKRRARWILNSGKKAGWKPTRAMGLCEAHFEEDQYELKRKDGRKLLKWNAVPTIFDFSNPRKRKQTGNESKKISTKKRASFGNASSDMYSINDDTTATSKELAMSVSQNQTNVTDDDVVEYAMEERCTHQYLIKSPQLEISTLKEENQTVKEELVSVSLNVVEDENPTLLNELQDMEHKFPSDPTRKKIWMERCHRPDLSISHPRLCKMHFSYNMFENDRINGKKKLKPNALPSLHLDINQSQTQKPQLAQKQKNDVTEISAETSRSNIYVSEDVLSEDSPGLENEAEAQFSISRVSLVDHYVVKSQDEVEPNIEISKKIYVLNITRVDDVIIKQDRGNEFSHTNENSPTLRISSIENITTANCEKSENNDFPTFNLSKIDNIILPKEVESSLKNGNNGFSVLPMLNINKVKSNSKESEPIHTEERSILIPCDEPDLESLSQFMEIEHEDANLPVKNENLSENPSEDELETEVKKLKQKVRDIHFALGKFLHDDQIEALLNPSNNHMWGKKSINLSRKFFRCLGEPGYNFLRSTNYPLPPSRMLTKTSGRKKRQKSK